MNLFSRRSLIASALFVGLLPTSALFAADAPKTVTVDWATYNPVSMLAQGTGLAGEGIRQGRHFDPLGADARLQQGARVPQCRLDRFRFDRGLGGAARQDQRQSDQGDLRLFEAGMDRAGHAQGHQHQDRRRSQGQARRRDPRHRPAHLPGAAATCSSYHRRQGGLSLRRVRSPRGSRGRRRPGLRRGARAGSARGEHRRHRGADRDRRRPAGPAQRHLRARRPADVLLPGRRRQPGRPTDERRALRRDLRLGRGASVGQPRLRVGWPR